MPQDILFLPCSYQPKEEPWRSRKCIDSSIILGGPNKKKYCMAFILDFDLD